MNLREEKGYTYGAGAGFEMRRAAGPFSARAAVNTEATVPAIADFLTEIGRLRDERVTDAELRAARDFLIGVFPLRFETPGPVVGALSGIVVHDLPDDELARYRPGIEAVAVDDVRDAAARHIDLDRAAIVLVGDADAFGPALEAAGFGPVVIERDDGPRTEGRPLTCPTRASSSPGRRRSRRACPRSLRRSTGDSSSERSSARSGRGCRRPHRVGSSSS
jgi:hypothetical protein